MHEQCIVLRGDLNIEVISEACRGSGGTASQKLQSVLLYNTKIIPNVGFRAYLSKQK